MKECRPEGITSGRLERRDGAEQAADWVMRLAECGSAPWTGGVGGVTEDC